MKVFILAISIGFTVTAALRADDFDDLKGSVQLRASAVQELKQRHIFQERSNGLLEASSPDVDPAQRNLLDAENADRTQLFELISKRTGKSRDDVAQAFARMAAALAPKGTPATASPPEPQDSPNGPNAKTDSSPSHPMGSRRSAKLPLRLLARPFANRYATPDEAAAKVESNVPAFTMFYAYQKVPGWYQVGRDDHGSALAWMREQDVAEWQQNLVIEFRHPEGRKQVLMFDEKKKPVLSAIAAADTTTRKSQVSELYRAIEAGELPPDFPVVTMEPHGAAAGNNYVLPIVDSSVSEINGREGRLLKLSAITRKREQTLLANKPDRVRLTQPPDINDPAVRDIKVDLVFVMDLTRSMGPFATRTLEMIKECSRRVGANKQLAGAIRFGVWGYRDFPELCRGIEYNTRNYTPELQALPDFVRTLGTVRETTVDSIDYEEDVLAGVADAIQQTKWTGDLRFLILVGDAPGRGPKERDASCAMSNCPEGTKAAMNEESIRRLADSNHIYFSGVYLNAPKWGRYAEAGERQFRTLSRNRNTQPGSENFTMVKDAHDAAAYGAVAEGLGNRMLSLLTDAQDGKLSDLADSTKASGKVENLESGQQAGLAMANNMFRGALVEWLGKQNAPNVPTDVTVWASDKDLIDPEKQSLEPKILLTRNELNSLKLMIGQVLDAGTRGQVSGESFFQSLLAVVSATTNDPTQIPNAKTLTDTGLVPEFIRDLPYHTTVQGMNNDIWRNMSPDAQAQFLRGIESKLRYYQLVYDNVENWKPFAEEDKQNRDKWVFRMPLDQLP